MVVMFDKCYCDDCGTLLPNIPNYVLDGYNLCISCWRERQDKEMED